MGYYSKYIFVILYTKNGRKVPCAPARCSLFKYFKKYKTNNTHFTRYTKNDRGYKIILKRPRSSVPPLTITKQLFNLATSTKWSRSGKASPPHHPSPFCLLGERKVRKLHLVRWDRDQLLSPYRLVIGMISQQAARMHRYAC